MQSEIDQMSGRQKFSRNFRRKVLSTFLRIPNVLLRNDKRFQKFICVFFVDKCSELVHIIISLGFRARLPGTVSNGLNARQLEIFTKMPLKGSFKLLKSIRCQLRNVQRFQKLIFFSVDKFSELLYTTIVLQYHSVIDTSKFYASDQTAGVLADLDPPTKLSENIILNVLVKIYDTLRFSAQ